MSNNNVHYIQGKWKSSFGPLIVSKNPADGSIVWEGPSATEADVNAAISAARQALPYWSKLEIDSRIHYLNSFKSILEDHKEELAHAISKEMGKPLWESRTEVMAMIGKVPISIQAYDERCPEKMQQVASAVSITRHKPHGVIGILGPFNFPGHLPNAHIIPALLAGNTIVFKPSEHTPLVAELMVHYWEKAGLPAGVINLVQGAADTGRFLTHHPDINGLFFTGSWRTGKMLQDYYVNHPGKILALEMGGNNPLVVWDIEDAKAAAYTIVQSAFITSGQRCTCARRLIVHENSHLLDTLIPMVQKLKLGAYTDKPEPYMGPVLSSMVAKQFYEKQFQLEKSGGKILLEMHWDKLNTGLISAGIVDVTAIKTREDDELFGPLLQVIRVKTFEDAIAEANNTAYGLSAGLISNDKFLYERFLNSIRAGIINWNMPTTGASSGAPFGGLGKSGNFRPSAYYASDYCAYPIASMERPEPFYPEILPPGMGS
jgi:succinylglutamic semialdehyde dehydrogenase